MDKVRKQMDSEENKKEEEKKMDQAKADAENGEVPNKLLTCLDALNSKLDAFAKRMDAYDDAKKDGAEAALVDAKKDGEEKRPLKADAFADSAARREADDKRRDEVSAIQSRAETVYSAHGNSVAKPMMNETAHEYLRRVAGPLRSHSAQWKDVNLRELPPDAMKVAADQIFRDSYSAATTNSTYEDLGHLHETRRVNRDTGHVIKEFYGQPRAWMAQFMMPSYRASFDMAAIKRSMRGD